MHEEAEVLHYFSERFFQIQACH